MILIQLVSHFFYLNNRSTLFILFYNPLLHKNGTSITVTTAII